ncbi:MAG TPA: polysaccharide pyruvyl transferase family protein [Bdellovibrionota bacterium]|nr:polysaccharide pyruvyl transferase family protein [Bdellovibrionota bacterium]
MVSWTEKITGVFDPDRALQAAMGTLIGAAEFKHTLEWGTERWSPGKALKLLLACYVGARNTGADVRVEEMIRQFRHILGDENIQLTIMTLDPELSARYFRTVRQIQLPNVFPKFLYDECAKHHGVVACEGSMFKSKFATALSTMMAGALGMANAESKLSIGYGAEAGEMTRSLREFVQKRCKHSLVICRNEPSRTILENLGIRTAPGTDTAWTFEPAPLERGAKLLRAGGWDGKTEILAVGPIHPFCWPVKPDLMKATARVLAGQFKEEHYKSIYFHHRSEEGEKKYRAYLAGLARAVTAFAKERPVFVALIGMERLDRRACVDLAALLPQKPPLFVSDSYDMYDLVSILRNVSYLVSSRFHAIVTSMPAQIPSAGVTMDERICNLMNDRGHADLFLEVDDPKLADRLLEILRILHRDSDRIADDIGRSIPKQLRLMGEMGITFADEVARVYPDFPRRNLPKSWENYLPPISRSLSQLLEVYA